MLRRTTLLLAACLLTPLAGASQEAVDIPVTTSSDAARSAFLQGQSLLDVGRNDEARTAFREAVDHDPRFTYAWLSLASAAASPGEFRASMKKAAESAPDKSEGEKLLVGVNETFLSADADRRIELSGRLVDRYSRSPRAWLTRGFALQSVDRHEDARVAFGKAIEIDPQMYAAHMALGFSYLFNEPRNPETAVVHMEHGAEISPREAKAHEALGDAYRAQGDFFGARDAYSKAMELDPDLGVASLKKGHVNSFLAHYEDARRDYDRGIRGADGANRITFANYRAFIQVHADRPEAAVRELRGIVEDAGGLDLSADDLYAVRFFTLTNAAAIAVHHGLSTQSREILADRSRLMRAESERLGDPDFSRRQEADIQLWKGRAAAIWGDNETAEQSLAAHRELLEPDRDPTRLQGYHLVQGLIALQRHEAVRAVTHLRQSDPEDQYVKYHLAVALEAAGHEKEARRLFAEVADFNFNSVDFALVRRDALKKKG